MPKTYETDKTCLYYKSKDKYVVVVYCYLWSGGWYIVGNIVWCMFQDKPQSPVWYKVLTEYLGAAADTASSTRDIPADTIKVLLNSIATKDWPHSDKCCGFQFESVSLSYIISSLCFFYPIWEYLLFKHWIVLCYV